MVVVGSEADFDALRKADQDVYSNMQTAFVDATERVGSLLRNSPYDLHLVVDVPPRGKRALQQAGGLLRLYGDVLAEVETDKAKGDFVATDEGVGAKLLVAAGAGEVKVGEPVIVVGEEARPPADRRLRPRQPPPTAP